MAEAAYLTPIDDSQVATLTPVEDEKPQMATLTPISKFEEMPFAGKHPNLYAAGKTVGYGPLS